MTPIEKLKASIRADIRSESHIRGEYCDIVTDLHERLKALEQMELQQKETQTALTDLYGAGMKLRYELSRRGQIEWDEVSLNHFTTINIAIENQTNEKHRLTVSSGQ